MYNYIFWVLYRGDLDKGKGKLLSRCNASGVVFISLFIHIALIVSIVKKYFFNFYRSFGINNLGNGSMILLVLIFMVLTFIYYNNKRINNIMDKYSEQTTYPTIENLKVLIIILIP
jgi:hypothetical protein